MKAELLKVRSMPTPLWCLLALVALALLGLAAVWRWGLGSEMLAFDLAIGFPSAVASIVFGAWVFGVEYGQKTMRRTLAADPRRFRLFVAKFLGAAVLVAAVTVALYLVALPLYDFAAGQHDQGVSIAESRELLLSGLIGNLVYVLVAGALVLITGSFAGGLTTALAFVFVLDNVLSLVPKVGDYSLGVALGDILLSIRPSQELVSESVHSVPVASLILAGWLVVLAGLGWLRLWRSDVT